MISRAWRGLWEHKIRTALALVGVAVCVLALTTADGMLSSMTASRMQDVARFTDRLLLQSPGVGYMPFQSVLREETVTTTVDWPDIIADESTALLFLILEPPNGPIADASVIGLGLWPGRERAWLGPAQLASGRVTLVGEGGDAVILGSQAARFYGVSGAGETVSLARRSWHVSGLLNKTGGDNVDNLVVMPLASAQAAFGLEGWISALLLTAKEGRIDNLARSLTAAYPTLEVNTQEDIRQILAQEMELPNKFLGTVSWAAFVIVGLIVANITSIAVRDRVQEVESVRAIGEGRSAILSYTVVEALLLALSGGLLGALMAVPTAYLFDWTWILSWGEMARVIRLVLAAGLLAGLYPAFRAARVYPQALRYDELRRQMEEVTAEKRAMDQAYRHLVRGREEERASLARELHDQSIQSLVGLKFHLAERAPAAQAELQVEIDEVIETLRELCAGLRPPALDRLGLAAALRSYVDDFVARTGLAVELNLDGDYSTATVLSSSRGSRRARRLSPESELSLFRVAQEALANAWKHAQAPKVEVSLSSGDTAVELTVCDRGRGFATPARLRVLAEAGHFGLLGMRERMELVGGELHLASELGQGTTITARAPFYNPE